MIGKFCAILSIFIVSASSANAYILPQKKINVWQSGEAFSIYLGENKLLIPIEYLIYQRNYLEAIYNTSEQRMTSTIHVAYPEAISVREKLNPFIQHAWNREESIDFHAEYENNILSMDAYQKISDKDRLKAKEMQKTIKQETKTAYNAYLKNYPTLQPVTESTSKTKPNEEAIGYYIVGQKIPVLAVEIISQKSLNQTCAEIVDPSFFWNTCFLRRGLLYTHNKFFGTRSTAESDNHIHTPAPPIRDYITQETSKATTLKISDDIFIRYNLPENFAPDERFDRKIKELVEKFLQSPEESR